MQLLLWRVHNKIRSVFGYPPVPKPCCRDLSNRGPVVREGPLTYQRCSVCQCRHFELVLDPGRLGLKGH